MTKLTNPTPLYLDGRGALLDAGYVYVGTAGADPQVSPITVYWDAALTQVAAQPLRTMGGAIVNNGAHAYVFFAPADYSIRVKDADGNLVDYVPSAVGASAQYQPLDSDLTAIAALGTTTFGRNLLALADSASLKTAAGVVDGLPLTGGTVSGAIARQGAGVHLYHVNAAYTSGRLYGPEYLTDPTTQPGDIWFKADA